MESAGARLKKLRLEKGLSLEDVYKKTKIHLSILKSIEEDNLVGISPIYIKGFLKIYCGLLGVDYKDYYSDSQEGQRTEKKAPEDTQEEPALSHPTPFKGTPFKLDYFKRFGIKVKNIIPIAVIILSVLGLFNLGKFIASRRSSNRAQEITREIEKADNERGKAQAVKSDQKGKKAGVKVAAAKKSATKPASNVSSGIRLSIRAKENCWVHLLVDSKVVFHAVLKKNKFESWQAKKKIEFSLGNAGGVELELNGKVIPPLGRRGQVVKNVLITKEKGLVVGR